MRNTIITLAIAAVTIVSSSALAQEEPAETTAPAESEATEATAPTESDPAEAEGATQETTAAAETPPAETPPAEPVTTEAEPEPAEEGKVFGPLDIDIIVHGGLGSFLYPHVEPYVDIGVVPLGKDLTLSIGGGVDLGWCALCGLLSLASGLDISGSYVGPSGRANLHLGSLGGLIPREAENFTLDVHVGVIAGPTVYRFSVKDADGPNAVSADQVSFLAGPTLGVRFGFANNRVLLLTEYRFTAEAGFSTVTVTDENGASQTISGENFSRAGSDFIVGIGLRI